MILIVDDDPVIRTSLRMLLSNAGYSTDTADSPVRAMEVVRRSVPELVLLDMNFSRFTTGHEGLTLLRQIKIFAPEVPGIRMAAWGSIGLAVEGMKAGAFDFITKPWDNRNLITRIATALNMSREPEDDPATDNSFDRSFIIGKSSGLNAVLDTVRRVAPTNAPVLITGESGTGKELIAEAIHRNSRRSAGPFVKVNLGGLSQSLFESEMFGHKKGAFTDAVADRVGRFEAADGGTIFLDEIGELDITCQVKLLRVLQEMRFEPLGSSKTKQVDVRVVCATNADLRRMVAARTFREDLYYRINLVNLELPPLRSRTDDIALLAEYFIQRAAKANGLDKPGIAPDAIAFLRQQRFPGNIRELKNLVERTLLMSGATTLSADDFRACTSSSPATASTLEDIERMRIIESLRINHGNMTQVAADLGLSRGALYRRIEKLNIDRNGCD